LLALRPTPPPPVGGPKISLIKFYRLVAIPRLSVDPSVGL